MIAHYTNESWYPELRSVTQGVGRDRWARRSADRGRPSGPSLPALARQSPNHALRWCRVSLSGVVITALTAFPPLARAWDYEGHRIVNQVALASLPADFPVFVHEPANAERIAWLCSEADRWRSTPDLPAKHVNAIDHYLDLEQLGDAGLTPATISAFRYEFAAQYAAGRAAHPQNFPAFDPARNSDHTREWCGFLPWTVTEYFGKLRGEFARLKVLEELGTPADVAQTKASICELMGVMGHFVGDGSQPLHTTIHHNGWVGANPQGYTNWEKIHAWIDGGFILKAGINFEGVRARVTPAEPFPLPSVPGAAAGRDPVFGWVMDYLQAQHDLVEPLYQLEKNGKLNHDDQPANPEGRAFIEKQLLAGGEMLGRLWYTAWRSAAPDSYLRAQLLRKQAAPPPAGGK
jgi:hypothetical protein